MLFRVKFGEKKMLVASMMAVVLAVSLLAVFPAMVSASSSVSDFILVKSVRFNPSITISSFNPFPVPLKPTNIPGTIPLDGFIQKRSVATFSLVNSSGSFVLNFYGTISGQLGPMPTNIGTITIRNKLNDKVVCDSFTELNISCRGGQMTMTIAKMGSTWSATLDNYTFNMSADIGTDGSNLGFSHAQIIGYKGLNPVITLNLSSTSFYFSYLRNPSAASVSFRLSGGTVQSISQPNVFTLRNTNVSWNFSNFADASNGGGGSVFNIIGKTGVISLNLQGIFTTNTSNTLRNEIYINFGSLQFSDCPVFNRTDVLCYIHSGYLHTYIPHGIDITFWKAPIRIFVLNITNASSASISGGQNAVGDVFSITNMTVSNFHFNQFP